ncbi:hypothetical protein ACFLTA_04640 [Bacteroidota bacterium]
MRKTVFLLVGLIFLCISCKKTDDNPQFSGEFLLSSEILQADKPQFYGFSFETGKISLYAYPAQPDLSAIHLIFGDTITVDLLGSDDEKAFHKNGNFSSAVEAETYFNNYNEVLATDFTYIARTIRENQVWTVHTAKERFAKIWIKEITLKTGIHSDFANIRVQYEYQPDSSRTFDCGCN